MSLSSPPSPPPQAFQEIVAISNISDDEYSPSPVSSSSFPYGAPLPPPFPSDHSPPSAPCSSSVLESQPQFGDKTMSSPSLHSYTLYSEKEEQQNQEHEQIDIRDAHKSPFLHGKFGTEAWSVSSPNVTNIDLSAGTLQETQIQFLKLLLLDPKFTFLHLLDDVLPPEDAAITSRMLLALMHANNYVVPALDSLVEKEVLSPKLSSPHQLFKYDSLATNMIITFTSIMGASYLHSLDDLITDLITKEEDFELDPRRNENPAEIQKNQGKILEYGSQLMMKLLGGLSDCPPEMQHVTQILSLEVMGRFPEWKDGGFRAVGMLLFTRFVCVAIVRPEEYTLYKPSQILPGLTTSWSGKPTIKPRVRRTLAFLSKLIHNSVANQKAKEPYLRFMDSFVQEFSPKVLEFCKRLSSPAQGYEPPSLSDRMQINNSALRHVVTIFSNNFEKIEATNKAPPQMVEQFDHFLKEIKNNSLGDSQKMENKSQKTTKMISTKTSAAAGAGVGALVGGAVGSVILPGVGTVVGAAVGGAFSGAGVYQIGHNQKAKKEREFFQTEMASIWDSFQHHTSCFMCYSIFSYTNRKHHCRACGHVVCNVCSRKRTFLQGIDWLVRVCDQCFILFPVPVLQERS